MNTSTRPKTRTRANCQLVNLGPVEIPHVGPRLIRVALPPGYDQSRKHHPLLLMWDGQNVFDDGPSFAGGWHVHTAVARRAARGKVAPVVVGLDHGGADRIRELAPWSPVGTSVTDHLLAWVTKTLVPALVWQFRLNAMPGGVTVGGSSLGGLTALYAHLKHPDVFGNALVMSPSLFLGRNAIFDVLKNTPKPWHTKVYLDAGGREAGGKLQRLTQRMRDALEAQGWHRHELQYRVVKTHDHNEQAWRRRMPRALKFLYG